MNIKRSIKDYWISILVAMVIVVIGVTSTCHSAAKHMTPDDQPADSVYDEMLEHEHVYPHFPKEPQTKPQQHLD